MEYSSDNLSYTSASPSSSKKWRKILYEDSGYPDNHVDVSFLDEMRKNISTPIYSLRSVVLQAEVVSRQLSCVSLFIVVFAFLFLEWTSPKFVLGVAGAVSGIGVLVYRLVEFSYEDSSSETRSDSHPSTSSVSPSLFSLSDCWSLTKSLPYLAFCYGLSPILITLTRTISGDTLFAMTATMLLAYLLLYDYRPSATMTSSPISLNAAIFASVCLASRLPTTLHTFAIVSVALTTFGLWPALHRRIGQTFSPPSLHGLSLILVVSSAAAVWHVSVVGCCLLLASQTFLLICCPLLFVYLQKDKHNIYGPWDEAVVKE